MDNISEENDSIPDELTILENMKKIYKGDNPEEVAKYYSDTTRNVFWPVSITATYIGHLEILKWFLKYEKNVRWFSFFEHTLSQIAASKGHVELLQYLYENEIPYSIDEVHPNCKEFIDMYGELWEKGIFVPIHDLKPAKNH